jgi:hypothetical protein
MMYKNGTEIYPHFEYNYDWYPSKEYQIHFLSTYLNEFKKFTIANISKNGQTTMDYNVEKMFNLNLDQLMLEVECFGLAAILYFAFWAVRQASLSNIEFGFMVFDFF